MKRNETQWLAGLIGLALVGCASGDGQSESGSTDTAKSGSAPAAEHSHDHGDGEAHDHSHDEPTSDEKSGAVADAHDHGHDHGDHDHDHGDHHAPRVLGPHDGRVLTDFGAPAELLVREDRFVQIAFLDEEKQVVDPGEPVISAYCGDRSDPTQLAFTKEGALFVSDQPLPEGMNIPMVLQVAMTAEAEKGTARISLDLSECPTCDQLEYACVCNHGHDDHDHGDHGHDHGDHGHNH